MHMRVFGSPAQIFVRAKIRDDQKLSDWSVSGTFVGVSDKGNGYIFLIQKSNELVQIDSKDAKFNETFSDYRGRQGKLTKASYIDPDLKEANEECEDNDMMKNMIRATDKYEAAIAMQPEAAQQQQDR